MLVPVAGGGAGAPPPRGRHGQIGRIRPSPFPCGRSVSGRIEIVSLLLANGWDPTPRRRWDSTGLMAASESASPNYQEDAISVVRLLLKDGRVPVDARNRFGRTALWSACSAGAPKVVRVLLVEGKADPTIPDAHGVTPEAEAERDMRRVRDWWEVEPQEPQGRAAEECVRILEWYRAKSGRSLSIGKARALLDATESIAKAAEKAGAKTEAEVRVARPEAAPPYLRSRVERGEALPRVVLKGEYDLIRWLGGVVMAEGGEERWAVLQEAPIWLKEGWRGAEKDYNMIADIAVMWLVAQAGLEVQEEETWAEFVVGCVRSCTQGVWLGVWPSMVRGGKALYQWMGRQLRALHEAISQQDTEAEEEMRTLRSKLIDQGIEQMMEHMAEACRAARAEVVRWVKMTCQPAFRREEQRAEEERLAVLHFVVEQLKEDLCIELAEGLGPG